MGQPAARITDQVLHKKGAGPILQGCPTVRINGLPAARKGDKVQHNQGVEIITSGEPTVRIGGAGLFAARIGDKVLCKGCIAKGSPNVRIGKTAPGDCLEHAQAVSSSFVAPADKTPAADANALPPKR